MTVLSQYTPYKDAFSGNVLPLVSQASLNSFPTLSPVSINSYSASQSSANQFLVSTFYASASNVNVVGTPFTVSDSGVITAGTAAVASNTSGTNASTTINSDSYPGETAFVSRSFFNGSYRIVYANSRITGSNTASSYFVDSGSDYTSNYPYPSQPVAISTSQASAATRFLIYPGYDPSSYISYSALSETTTSYSRSSSGSLSTYSSTCGGAQALQHFSDTSSRNGVIFDHRSATSGFYLSECHSGSTVTGLGYVSNIFNPADFNNYSYYTGFKLSSGKSVYVSKTGNSFTTNSTGSILGSSKSLSLFGNVYSYYQPFTQIALGNNVFALLNTTSSQITIFKIIENATTYVHDINVISRIQVDTTIIPPLADGSSTFYRFGGTNNKFLIVFNPFFVKVYDASSLTLS